MGNNVAVDLERTPLRPVRLVDGYLPIEDHGLIGDGCTAGLISAGVALARQHRKPASGVKNEPDGRATIVDVRGTVVDSTISRADGTQETTAEGTRCKS